MIIPTAEYNPMFADDGIPFRDKMIDYILCEFSDTLGPRAGLLHRVDGIETLSAIYIPAATESSRQSRAA